MPTMLVAATPTRSTSSAVIAMPSPGTARPSPPRDERLGDAVDDAEDPDERGDADDERDGDEESRDEAAPQPGPHVVGQLRPAISHTATAAASASRYQANTDRECDARYRRKYLIVR